MAHIEHVLQQGEGVVGQIAEGILDGPGGRVLLEHRHQGQGHGVGRGGITAEHKQQPLGRGGGVGPATAAQGVDAGAGISLGDSGAAPLAIKAPAVVWALQLALVVEAPLGEGHEPVGADIGEGPPTPGLAVVPEDQILGQQGEGSGTVLRQILEEGHRVPTAAPDQIFGRHRSTGMENTMLAGFDQHWAASPQGDGFIGGPWWRGVRF